MKYKEFFESHLISEKFGDVEKSKWKRQNPHLTDTIVNDYISKFDTIRKARPAAAQDDISGLGFVKGNDRYDISKYKNWQDFEAFVDYVNGQIDLEKAKGKKFDDIQMDAKPLVSKNGLEVYYATDKHACIKYVGDKPYSWCVSRSDSSNMYNTYRYKHNEPSFYFVKDVEATKKEFERGFGGYFKNPWHFFVIQKTKYPDDYIVTNANNDGDDEMTWSELVDKIPKLNGMQEYFANVPLTDIEKKNYDRFIRGLKDSEFCKLSYGEKEAYLDIAIPSNTLSDIQFECLPNDLKNKYIGYGLSITEGMFEIIKKNKNKNLYKRLVEMCVRKFEAYKNRHFDIYNFNSVDFKVLLSLPNAKDLLKFHSPFDFGTFIEQSELGVDELLKTYGADYLAEYFKDNPQMFFNSFNTIEDMEKCAKLLGTEKMKNVKIDISNISQHNPKHRIFFSGHNLAKMVDLLSRYKTKLSNDDCLQILGWIKSARSYNGVKKEEVHAVCDEFLKLYKQNKITKYDSSDNYAEPNFVAELILNSESPEKVIEAVSPEVLSQIGDYYLQRLFTINNPAVKRTFATAFKKSMGGIAISDLINTVVRGSREKIIKTVNALGGFDVVKKHIPSHAVTTMLYNTPTQNLPVVASLIQRKYLSSNYIGWYELRTLLTHVGSGIQYDKLRFPLMTRIIGKDNIVNVASGHLGSYLSDLDQYGHGTYLKQQICEWFAKNAGAALSNDDIRDLLMYPNDPMQVAKLLGSEKIDQLTTYSVKRILLQRFQNKNASILKQTIDLLGTQNISKMFKADKDSYNIFYIAARSIYYPYLIQHISDDAITNSDIVYIILKNTWPDQWDTVVSILGPQKIAMLSGDDIASLWNSRLGDAREKLVKTLQTVFDKNTIIAKLQDSHYSGTIPAIANQLSGLSEYKKLCNQYFGLRNNLN